MTVADSHFAIGKTHDVCQDYAIGEDPAQSGLNGSLALAIVCDGCSSSPDTDWGARFLARAAAMAFWPFNPLNVVQKANVFRQALQLQPQALDATLLMIRETKNGDAEVIVCGDGVVVARRRDGSGYDHWALSYSLNAPAYLTYLLDADRQASYLDCGGGILTVTGSPYEAPEDIEPGVSFTRTFPRAEYDVVLVLSDGSESFQKREGTRFVPVPLTEVLDQVLDFKTLTHGFIKRRVIRFLGKFCHQNEWQHNDDLAVAGLVLDAPEVAS